MKSVVCWIWGNGADGSRRYLPNQVNVLQRMFARNLREKHRFVCVTDETKGFDKGVEVFPTPPEAIEVGRNKSPEGLRFPSCYRRLWMFSEGAKVFGDRVMLIDVDLVVLRDVSPIFDLTADFVGWRPFRDWGAQMRYGGGIYLLTPGTRRKVWEDFKGETSIRQARAAGFRGSDQAWLSYKLGPNEIHWPKSSGIYSIRDFPKTPHAPPNDARLVQFNGPTKPWNSPLTWARQNWR